MANTNPAHVVLTNVRLSYTHLTEPWGRTTKRKLTRRFVPQRKPRGRNTEPRFPHSPSTAFTTGTASGLPTDSLSDRSAGAAGYSRQAAT